MISQEEAPSKEEVRRLLKNEKVCSVVLNDLEKACLEEYLDQHENYYELCELYGLDGNYLTFQIRNAILDDEEDE